VRTLSPEGRSVRHSGDLMDGKGAEADRAIPGEKITPERPVKGQYVTETTTGQYVMDTI
jgi:hypothetical protein